MKGLKKSLSLLAILVLVVTLGSVIAPKKVQASPAKSTVVVSAAEEGAETEETVEEDASTSTTGNRAIAAGIAIGLAAGAGALGMGIAVGRAGEGISRQPEADGKIRTTLMLGLVFIETAIIYSLIVAILIIFVM